MQTTFKATWDEAGSNWPRLSLQMSGAASRQVGQFFKTLKTWQADGDIKTLTVGIETFETPRTISQNSTYRGLVSILAHQRYGERGWEPLVHEAILQQFGTMQTGPDGEIFRDPKGRPIPKRTAQMSRAEMAKLIEGLFAELALEEVPMESLRSYRNYWLEWRQWRGKQKHDPIAYESREDKRKKTPFCEACQKGGEIFHLAHVVSEKASGINEPWVFLVLCAECHIHTQHASGWIKLVDQNRHLQPAIDRIRERAKAAPIVWPWGS